MKIDIQGIDELKSTIETPFQALAEQLDKKGYLDTQTSEIITFIFENFAKLGESPWEIID